MNNVPSKRLVWVMPFEHGTVDPAAGYRAFRISAHSTLFSKRR